MGCKSCVHLLTIFGKSVINHPAAMRILTDTNDCHIVERNTQCNLTEVLSKHFCQILHLYQLRFSETEQQVVHYVSANHVRPLHQKQYYLEAI